MSGAHIPDVGASHDGRAANASPTYVQWTRSTERRIGIRWNLKPPDASRSPPFSGSVVQYAYQPGSPAVRLRMTVGSAQLSTRPPPGIEISSGFVYPLPAAAPTAGAASAATAATSVARTRRTSRASKTFPLIAPPPRAPVERARRRDTAEVADPTPP